MSVCFFGSPPTLSNIVRQYCILCFLANKYSLSLFERGWGRLNVAGPGKTFFCPSFQRACVCTDLQTVCAITDEAVSEYSSVATTASGMSTRRDRGL